MLWTPDNTLEVLVHGDDSDIDYSKARPADPHACLLSEFQKLRKALSIDREIDQRSVCLQNLKDGPDSWFKSLRTASQNTWALATSTW